MVIKNANIYNQIDAIILAQSNYLQLDMDQPPLIVLGWLDIKGGSDVLLEIGIRILDVGAFLDFITIQEELECFLDITQAQMFTRVLMFAKCASGEC